MEYQQELRKKVIEFFGGKCMNPNCLVPGGCTDRRCLQIDHIKAVGKNRLVGTDLYLDILGDPNSKERYQLLCANCNWIKRTEKNEIKGFVISEEQQSPLNYKVVHIGFDGIEPRYASLEDVEKTLNES